MNLSENNLKIATEYFLGNLEPFHCKDKDFQNLFLTYATDVNSSTLREQCTLNYLGYKPFNQKHGADGIDESTNRFKEVKPKQIQTGKIGYSGCFNDLTLELLDKKKEYDVVCSLFFQSQFVYIVEFPISVIYEHIRKPIVEAKQGKRVVSMFTYCNYDSDELKVHYLNKNLLHSLSEKHAKMLLSRI